MQDLVSVQPGGGAQHLPAFGAQKFQAGLSGRGAGDGWRLRVDFYTDFRMFLSRICSNLLLEPERPRAVALASVALEGEGSP